MKSVRDLSNLLPLFLVVGVSFGCLIAFYIGGVSMIIQGLQLSGLPLLIAAGTMIVQRRRGITSFATTTSSPIPNRYTSWKVFSIFYMMAIVTLALSPVRSYLFFVLIGILYTIPLVNVLLNDDTNTGIILVQCVSLLLLTAFSLTLNYPLFFGYTDLLPHISMYKYTAINGATIPPSHPHGNNGYFPLFHIFIAQYAQIAGQISNTMYFVISGATFSLSPLLVYLLCKKLTNNSTILKLSPVVYSALPSVIYHSAYTVTRVFAVLGALLIFISLFTVWNTSRNGYRLIYLLSVFYTLFVHHVSYLQISFIIFVLILSGILVGVEWRMSISSTLILALPFCVYWVFVSYSIFLRVLQFHLFRPDSADVSGSVSAVTFHISEYINNYIFIIALMIGVYLSMRDENKRMQMIGLFGLLLSTFMMYSPIHVLEFAELLRVDRLVLLLSPMAAILISYGLVKTISPRWNKIDTIRIGLLIFLFVVFAASSATGGIFYDTGADSPDVEWAQPPEHFIESELAAFEFVNHIPDNETIASDWQSERYIVNLAGDPSLPSQSYTASSIAEPNDLPENYTFIREYRMSNKGVILGEDRTVHEDDKFEYSNKNIIYSNEDVKIAL